MGREDHSIARPSTSRCTQASRLLGRRVALSLPVPSAVPLVWQALVIPSLELKTIRRPVRRQQRTVSSAASRVTRVRAPRPTSKIQMSLPSSDGPLSWPLPGPSPERSAPRCTDLDPEDADDAAIAVEPRQPRRRSGRPSDTPAHRWADTENAPAPLPVLMRIRSAMGTGVPLTTRRSASNGCAKSVVSRRKKIPARPVAHALEQQLPCVPVQHAHVHVARVQVEEMPAVRKKAGTGTSSRPPQSFASRRRTAHRPTRLGGSACPRPGGKQNGPVAVPITRRASRIVGDRGHRSGRHVETLELSVRDEREMATVGRPERAARALGARERLRVETAERARIHSTLRPAASGSQTRGEGRLVK